ncbi:MAG: hypothetical protein ROR55_21195 [Devosia sp.]
MSLSKLSGAEFDTLFGMPSDAPAGAEPRGENARPAHVPNNLSKSAPDSTLNDTLKATSASYLAEEICLQPNVIYVTITHGSLLH